MPSNPLPRGARRALIALSASLAAASTAFAGAWVGAPAKELKVESIVSPAGVSPSDVTLAASEGTTRILAFWSTSCPSCPEVLPHLKSLQDEFKGQPVTFFSILKESKPEVESFLKKFRAEHGVTLDMPIALDEDLSITNEYFVPGVPMAVIVNADNFVVAKIHPKQITPEAIREAMSGNVPRLPVAGDPEQLLPEKPQFLPVFEKSVRPAQPMQEPSLSLVAGARFTATPLRDILGRVFGVQGPFVISDDVMLDARYDVTAIPRRGNEAEVGDMLKDLLQTSFEMTATTEQREIEVLVLSLPGDPGPMLQPAKRPRYQIDARPGLLRANNAMVAHLAYELFPHIGTPIIDETGLDQQRFDAFLNWTSGDLESFKAAMKKNLGIEVTSATREMTVLVVEKNEPVAAKN
ncbi:MAG: TIGR03435 family protein [Planctomycetota bacterium]|nr:TIGR03435 family protein [Planctomycetota bacterium]